MSAQTSFFTYVLTSVSLAITPSNNVTEASILCSSGTITITGNAVYSNGDTVLQSAAITVSAGQSITLSASQSGSVLGGITINALGGTAQLLFRF